MSKLCVLGKWSPRYFRSFFHTFRTRPFRAVLGDRRERGGRGADKAAGFLPWPNLGTRGFTYMARAAKPTLTGSPELVTLHPESGPARRAFLRSIKKMA